MGLFDKLKKKNHYKSEVEEYYANRKKQEEEKEQKVLKEEARQKERADTADASFQFYDGFEMTVQDVFTITGRGTVATGQVKSGRVEVGQTVLLERAGQEPIQVKVDGIEANRKKRKEAAAGDMVGLLIKQAKEEVRTGDRIYCEREGI